jgi:hypothetical protein
VLGPFSYVVPAGGTGGTPLQRSRCGVVPNRAGTERSPRLVQIQPEGIAKSCDGMIRLRGSEMKAFVAALVAVGILYAVDREYNDGRYSSVVQQAIAAMVPR